jgi:hypothetical protein
VSVGVGVGESVGVGVSVGVAVSVAVGEGRNAPAMLTTTADWAKGLAAKPIPRIAKTAATDARSSQYLEFIALQV